MPDFNDLFHYAPKELYGLEAALDGYNAVELYMASTTMDFVLDEQDGIWEIACAPHSWLSEACDQQGLRPRRINLQQGYDRYDIYKTATWERLKGLRRRHRPRRLWFSLPCTKWCEWSKLNYATEERQELLATYRRRERRNVVASCSLH